jgi:hypothetical protein
MIVNTRQYSISERKLITCISLRRKLLQRLPATLNPDTTQLEIDNLKRQAEFITTQMKDYIALRSGRIAPPDLSEVSDLPHNLIRARIALGWSPRKLARQIGIDPSQVHRWESTYYASVSLSRVLSVADLLNAALKRQNRPVNLLGKPLKLGADWFDCDFRQLPDHQ